MCIHTQLNHVTYVIHADALHGTFHFGEARADSAFNAAVHKTQQGHTEPSPYNKPSVRAMIKKAGSLKVKGQLYTAIF